MKNIFLAFFLLSMGLHAQSGKHEKIKALKTAYITSELELSTAEAEKFWPVYNDFDNKLHDIRKAERREIFEKFKAGIDNLTDEEANALIDKAYQLEATSLQLREDLTKNLRKIISPKKIIKLRKVEEDFKKKLLDRYRNHKKSNK
ncbi:hypothetical protein [Ulvibacter litoralis]|uniref:LTXXQ motif family protein n=1 Tax=Ulvibacter litoralis TaxID=227084 RepID=A0A1G7F1W3_9FLAO|nr:hypothetical protein [Ulvibacter litoralis]GHC52975.1 hypothetical protein GCM10008083_16170 [Ulvibacter litoralis]SDE69953.1 hypothetical protein SAMN05421855_102282 [Ulvibacter litoralis]